MYKKIKLNYVFETHVKEVLTHLNDTTFITDIQDYEVKMSCGANQILIVIVFMYLWEE